MKIAIFFESNSKTGQKDSTYVKNFSNTFIKLLENSQFIPRSELTLEWRPLYKMYQRFHHNPKAARYALKFYTGYGSFQNLFRDEPKFLFFLRYEFLNFLSINFQSNHFIL